MSKVKVANVFEWQTMIDFQSWMIIQWKILLQFLINECIRYNNKNIKIILLKNKFILFKNKKWTFLHTFLHAFLLCCCQNIKSNTLYAHIFYHIFEYECFNVLKSFQRIVDHIHINSFCCCDNVIVCSNRFNRRKFNISIYSMFWWIRSSSFFWWNNNRKSSFFLNLFTNEMSLKIDMFDSKMKFEIVNENNNFLIVNFDRDKNNK